MSPTINYFTMFSNFTLYFQNYRANVERITNEDILTQKMKMICNEVDFTLIIHQCPCN